MRKWHRWLSVFFGIFMLWIAVTGVLSHVFVWWPEGGDGTAPAETAAPEGFVCPEGWRCIAPPPPGGGGMRSLVGFMHHLHSGSEFGPVGEFISFLSGLALIFFAVSGIWMYVQMWRNRTRRKLKGGLFWK